MPLTVFNCKGISDTGRERIGAAVEAGGKHRLESFEGWVAKDPSHGGVHVLITGPHTFERRLEFGLDEVPAEISRRVRETLEAEL